MSYELFLRYAQAIAYVRSGGSKWRPVGYLVLRHEQCTIGFMERQTHRVQNVSLLQQAV